MSSPPLFLPADFFLVRVASLPIEFLFSLFNKKTNIGDWAEDPFFRQALLFTSPSLYKELEKGKKSPQITRSLLKYFARNSSRATPYGLFSFVSWGKAGSSSQSFIDLDLLVKRVRPDMGWLQNYLFNILKDDLEILNCELQTHPLIKEKENRYLIDYFIDQKSRKNASIKKNSLTSLVFSYCVSPKSFKELFEFVKNQFSQVDESKVFHTLKKLIEEQFLWPTFFPNLKASSPFSSLLKKLPGKYREELSSLEGALLAYQEMSLDQGEEALGQLFSEMGKKAASLRFPLQAELSIPSKSFDLPQKVLENVALGAEVLWKLSSFTKTDSSLKQYHLRFLEKYGQQRLVPLFELLDPNQGLGGLSKKAKKEEELDNKNLLKWASWQSYALSRALIRKDKEIVLDDQTLDRFTKEVDKETARESLDLFFELYADSSQAIDQGDYLVFLRSFVSSAGSTFGRFWDVLDPEVTDSLRKLYEMQDGLKEDILNVECFYLPENSNVQNIATSPSFRDSKISLLPGDLGNVFLSQIYVGGARDFLYLTSREGGIEFKITSTNVLTDLFAPEPIQFVQEVSRKRSGYFEVWKWNINPSPSYLPRVRYKNIILSPALWWINTSTLNVDEKESIQSVMKKLESWANELELPRYIFIVKGDNRLLIDRFYRECLEIAALELKKNGALFLAEKIDQDSSTFFSSKKGSHVVEYVLPLFKNQTYHPKAKKIPQISYKDYAPIDRFKVPGEDWLYYQVYLPVSDHNIFLKKYLDPFCKKLLEAKFIEQWFFIRYCEDGKDQIRFRLRGEKSALIHTVFERVSNFAKELLSASVIKAINLSVYEREIERYGGIEMLELCETLFCIDSQLVLDLLSFESETLSLPVIGAMSSLNLLSHLGFDLGKQVSFFQRFPLKKKELSGYREARVGNC